MDGSAHLII